MCGPPFFSQGSSKASSSKSESDKRPTGTMDRKHVYDGLDATCTPIHAG
jgi:hypothetical protein